MGPYHWSQFYDYSSFQNPLEIQVFTKSENIPIAERSPTIQSATDRRHFCTQGMIMPHLTEFAGLCRGSQVSVHSSESMEYLMRGASDVARRSQFNPGDNLVERRLPDSTGPVYGSPNEPGDHWFEGPPTNETWLGSKRPVIVPT